MQAFDQKLGKPTENGHDIFSFTGKGSLGKWRPITLSRIEKLLLESEFDTHGLDGQYSYFLRNLITGFFKLDVVCVKDLQRLTVLHPHMGAKVVQMIPVAADRVLLATNATCYYVHFPDFPKISVEYTRKPPVVAVGLSTIAMNIMDSKEKDSVRRRMCATSTFGKIRQDTDSHDFSIYCLDEDEVYSADSASIAESQTSEVTTKDTMKTTATEPIRVHSLVLKSVWPFFKGMLDCGMSEAESMSMTLPYPRSWVEALIRFFYDDHNVLSFEDATGLVVLAKVYDMPSIHLSAIERIKNEGTLNLSQALLAWRRSYEADANFLRTHCAQFIREHFKDLSKATQLLPDYSQEELLCLLSDLALCMDTKTNA